MGDQQRGSFGLWLFGRSFGPVKDSAQKARQRLFFVGSLCFAQEKHSFAGRDGLVFLREQSANSRA